MTSSVFKKEAFPGCYYISEKNVKVSDSVFLMLILLQIKTLKI